MDSAFLTVLNMSLMGAFVIAAICLARLPLKKAPKIISYCLWAVAGFRLVFPFSIESVLSLIPFKAQPIPPDIAMQAVPRIDSGIRAIDNAVSMSLPMPNPVASVNPLQIWQFAGACVWLAGVAVLVIYGVVSFVILRRKMRAASRVEENIFEAENIQTPFVLGVFKPGIYLPSGLSGREREYIVLHEQTHIRRRDHIVKLAAYFILCVHWFNPLAWIAFLLMGVDMEMSCDERVLRELGGETRRDYSLSLLSLATRRHIVGGSPLAFSEGGLKARIKNVLNFKKPSRVIIALSVALVAALTIGFALNRAGEGGESDILDGKTLTINKVRELSAKGDGLMFEDFQEYWGADASSNTEYHIMVYVVEGGYRLVVRSKANSKPDSADLESIWEGGGSGIDIRYGDIDKFLIEHPSRPLASVEAGEVAKIYTGQGKTQLQEITGATNEQIEQIETHLVLSNITYETVSISTNPITEGMDPNWQAYDLLTEGGLSYVLILGRDNNGFCAVLHSNGRLISGLIDGGVMPALFPYGEILRPPMPLAALPTYYSMEQAVADGVFVSVFGMETFNQAAVDAFYKDVAAGTPSFMRTIHYTVEGDPIITDYEYDGTVFTVAEDKSRDKYGSYDLSISTMTYKYLVPYKQTLYRGAPATYYLSNDEDILTGTGEGATLKDGLWQAPTPFVASPIYVSLSQQNPLEVSAWELREHYLFTSSEKITVSIPRGDYGGTFYLYDADDDAESIMSLELDQAQRVKAFTELSSEKCYYITASGIDNSARVSVTG